MPKSKTGLSRLKTAANKQTYKNSRKNREKITFKRKILPPQKKQIFGGVVV